MKKLILAAFAGLLLWNVWLTVKLNSSLYTEDSEGKTVIQHTVNSYTSEVSEMLSDVQSSVVCVESVSSVSTKTLSGIIYAEENGTVYVFTECSAVRYADSVNIIFNNGLSVEAVPAGYDAATNTALLSCTPGFEVTPVSSGSVSAVEEGEYTAALGGKDQKTLSASLSAGACSKNGYRRISSDSLWAAETFEFDAEISSNMIGGGLFNVGGDLLGMLIDTPQDGYSAKSYAVTADELSAVYSEIKEAGAVTRGQLGLVVRSVSEMKSYEKNARNMNLDRTTGVLVTYMYAESPCSDFVQTGDILTEIDDHEIQNAEDLRTLLYAAESGTTVTITGIRNGESYTESVQLQ